MSPVLSAVSGWLAGERSVESAVLFGSAASDRQLPSEAWSDFDLHIISTLPAELEQVRWEQIPIGGNFCFQSVRPATGGVRKVTAIFTSAQIDLIIVPATSARLARLMMQLGLQQSFRAGQTALNEMATCLRTGYRFLKGEKKWGRFYARVNETMAGVRLEDGQVRQLADAALTDALWVLQKVARGEFVAAQHVLHRQLSDTNLRLLRELRLRQGMPLPSFGLGRHAEALPDQRLLRAVTIDARPNAASLPQAVRTSLDSLELLMKELLPGWSIPPAMRSLLAEQFPG